MGNQSETHIYRAREKAREFIEKEMTRPYGKEILEIEGKITELEKKMGELLIKRYEIEEQRRK